MTATTLSGAYLSTVTLDDPATFETAFVTGTIAAASGPGIALPAGGVVDVRSSGALTGVSQGILAAGQPAGLTNAGRIIATGGSASAGIALLAGGSITNLSGGLIAGNSGLGVTLVGAGTVRNAGTIQGQAGAVRFSAGQSNRLIVDPGAVFDGSVDGGNLLTDTLASSTLELASGDGTVGGTLTALGDQFVNFASIVVDDGARWTLAGKNTVATGAKFSVVGSLINLGELIAPGVLLDQGYIDNRGTIQGYVALDSGAGLNNSGSITSGAIAVYSNTLGSPNTVTNSGVLDGIAYFGVELRQGGLIENAESGTISGGFAGVYTTQPDTTVTNRGLIFAPTGADYSIGVALGQGGMITNLATGTITGGVEGIMVYNQAATVVNSGRVDGTFYVGLWFQAGGTVINHASGVVLGGYAGVYASNTLASVINQGQIAARTGNRVSDGVALYGGGYVSNSVSGTISGGDVGVLITGGAGTVVNAGSIFVTGTSGSAIKLASGFDHRVVFKPGAYTYGLVDGGNAIGGTHASTLELAAGGSGTIAGWGGTFINFARLEVDAGAIWTLNGSNTLAEGATLTVDGALFDNGRLRVATLAGSGGVTIGSAGVLELSGSASSSAGIVFGNSPGGVLLLPGVGSGFSGSIGGFAAGDRIELAGVSITEASIVDSSSSGSSGAAASGAVSVRVRGVRTATSEAVDYTLASVGLADGVSGSFLIGQDLTNGAGFLQAVMVPRTLSWTGSVGTEFADPANWNDLTDGHNPALRGPNAADTGIFLASGGTIEGTGTVGSARFVGSKPWALVNGGSIGVQGSVTVGGPAGGRLSLTSGALLTADGSLHVMADSGQNATLIVDGGATTLAARGIDLGGVGAASLSVANAGTLAVGTDGIVLGSDEHGVTAISAIGAGAAIESAGAMVIGDLGFGSLSILSGAHVSANAGGAAADGATIARVDHADGSSVTVSGAGSSWQIGGRLVVGADGAGGLAISAGGSVAAGSIEISRSEHGVGNVSVTGQASRLIADGTLIVGNAAAGVLSIQNGATVGAAAVTLGLAEDGTGNLDIQGAGSSLLISGRLIIGGAGHAQLTIGKGATVSATDGFTVGLGGVVTQFGGVLDPPVISLNAGLIGGIGTLEGDIENNGTISAGRGRYELTGNVTTGAGQSGTLTIAGGPSQLVLDQGVDGGQHVFFSSATGTLTLLRPGLFQGIIHGFQFGDTIEAIGATGGVFDGDTQTLTLDSGGVLRFASGIAGGTVTVSLTGIVSATATASTDLTGGCFAEGSGILTERGRVPIETLRPGQTVRTASGRSAPIVWIGHRRVECLAHPNPEDAWPIRIAPHTFGPGLPERPLFLSSDHAVFVDGVLIPIGLLLNGDSIRRQATDCLTYWHLALDRHDIVLAEGLPTESYLDTEAPDGLGTGASLFSDFNARKWESDGYAALILTGPALEAVRARLSCAGARVLVPDARYTAHSR